MLRQEERKLKQQDIARQQERNRKKDFKTKKEIIQKEMADNQMLDSMRSRSKIL